MTEKKSQEKADLEIEVAGLQHLNALDEQLEIQVRWGRLIVLAHSECGRCMK